MSDTVLYEADGPIATVTLNRPENMNTMNIELLAAAVEILERVASDDAIRAVIFTGNGRAFCAGGDLGGGAGGGVFDDRPVQQQVESLRRAMRTSQLLHDMPKVTIAAINGACAGAGLSWACACDIRYAAESAKFNTAFLSAGVSGDFGGTWTLPRIVGPAKARELYMLSERFTAEDAARLGLVTRVLPNDELMPAVRDVAERLSKSAPVALQHIKANFNDSERLSFSEALDREADRHTRCSLMEDATEAANAFMEKREPVFTGR
jgi:2-(1,2-epoxy-1,2-dihydrophenyl)acetyl-CoA isomerase